MKNNKNANVKRVWIVSNYNYDPSDVIAVLDAPFILCQQGDSTKVPSNIIDSDNFHAVKHTGHNLSDYLRFIIENYNNLPDESGFIKGNIFPRHINKTIFLKRIKHGGFIPLYSDNNTYKAKKRLLMLIAQQVAPGYFLEISNNWYISERPKGKYYPTLESMFEKFMGRSVPEYIPFVPGGCMIVPKDNILRWPLRVYQHLYEVVTYDFFPVEAFHLERCMLYFFAFLEE